MIRWQNRWWSCISLSLRWFGCVFTAEYPFYSVHCVCNSRKLFFAVDRGSNCRICWDLFKIHFVHIINWILIMIATSTKRRRRRQFATRNYLSHPPPTNHELFLSRTDVFSLLFSHSPIPCNRHTFRIGTTHTISRCSGWRRGSQGKQNYYTHTWHVDKLIYINFAPPTIFGDIPYDTLLFLGFVFDLY